MRRINRIFLYKVVAIICLIILCSLQFLHISNIYKLENQYYNSEEKNTIKILYEKSITNDKVFPGAQIISDKIIYDNYNLLMQYSKTDLGAFKKLTEKVCDTLFAQLTGKNNIDAFFKKIKAENNIMADAEYALIIEQIDVAFLPNQYYNIFDKNKKKEQIHKKNITGIGYKIGGSLDYLNSKSLITSIKVSSSEGHSYKMAFSLYADTPNRFEKVFMRMLPQTLLSIFTIIAIFLIFLFTFSNWVKQKKMSEMKSDFINTITHEFQTPLTTIIIANRTIENENQHIESDKITSLNAIIKRQTERLNILITQVTDTSVEKPFSLTLCNINAGILLEEIIADYRVNIDTSMNLIFKKDGCEDFVLLDKLHFTSIILNVLDNAVKYNNKANKTIAIHTYQQNKETLVISIKDNGDGMSKKVQRNMFERFYRNPSLTTKNTPGLGQGLYYTKQCLDAHHWQYEVKTKLGVGTEFIIYIPVEVKSKTKIINLNKALNQK